MLKWAHPGYDVGWRHRRPAPASSSARPEQRLLILWPPEPGRPGHEPIPVVYRPAPCGTWRRDPRLGIGAPTSIRPGQVLPMFTMLYVDEGGSVR